MPAPAPVNGNLISTIRTPYTTTTLPGTASVADYIDYSNPNAYSFFGDFLQSGSNLVFTVADPFSNKSGSLAFPRFGRQLILSTMNQGSSDEANQIHR